MAGGGRNHLVPPPSQVQAPGVDAYPLVSVSRPPPRARPALRLPSFPAYPPPKYAGPLLSTTSPPAPPALGRCRFDETVDFLPLDEVCPPARPNPGPARPLFGPRRHLHGGGPLEAASAAIPAPFAAALATLTRFCSRARAGLILSEAGSRGGLGAPPPPRRRPPHRRAPAPRAPDTLSTPLPSLTPPSPSSLPSQLTPPSPLTPLVNPYFPTRCTNPRAVASSLL